MVLHIEENTFEKSPVGLINTMAAITAQVLVDRGLPQPLVASIINECLKKTVSVVTGKAEAVIIENKASE